RERLGRGARRTEPLRRSGLVLDVQVHEPDARAHAFSDLLLDVGRRLYRRRLFQVRIDADRAGQRVCGDVSFFTGLVMLVARNAGRADLRVGPLIRDDLLRLVRVRVLRHADAGVELVQSPVRLEDGLAVAHQVVAQAKARDDAVPFDVVRLGERLRRDAEAR